MINQDQRLAIKISGTSMNDESGYELRYLIEVLGGIQTLVDKTYLHSKGNRRLSEEDERNLTVLMSESKRGSFNADVLIILREVLLPVLPEALQTGAAVWTAIQEAYSWLKINIDTRKEGKEVMVEQTGDGIVVTGNNNTINVGYTIPELANELAPVFRKMTRDIDGKKLESISLADCNEKGSDIVLSIEDRDRFKKKTVTSDETTIYSGKVIEANVEQFKGKLKTLEGIYSFTVAKNLWNEADFVDLLGNNVDFVCRTKYLIDPSQKVVFDINGLIVEKILNVD